MPTSVHTRMIINLIIWVNKKDVIFYCVKTNNLHVMCNGWIIALVMILNIINVVSQNRYLNQITIKLEMVGPFQELYHGIRMD